MVRVKSSDKSQELVEEVDLDVFSTSDSDVGPAEADRHIIMIPQGIMSLRRMSKLFSMCRVPPDYIYKI